MDYNDFIKLEIYDDFGEDDDIGESDVMQHVIDQLRSSCTYAFGASQFVIISSILDKVIKIPFYGSWSYDYDEDGYATDEYKFYPFKHCRDYCKRSVEIYEKAEDAGVAEIFAKTEYFDDTCTHHPLYLQEKIEVTYSDDDEKTRTPTKGSLKKVQDLDYKATLPPDWLALAIDQYGEKYVTKFLAFCKQEKIRDLHWENIGYRKDGRVVIIDYASWFD